MNTENNNENREQSSPNSDNYRRDGNNYHQKRNPNNYQGGNAPRRNYENRPPQRGLPDNYGNRWGDNSGENRDRAPRSWDNRTPNGRPPQQRSWNNNRPPNSRPQSWDGNRTPSNRPQQQSWDGNRTPNNRPQQQGWNSNRTSGNYPQYSGNRNADYPPRRQWSDANNGNFSETRFENHQSGGVKFRKPKRKINEDFEIKHDNTQRQDYGQEYFDPTKPVRLNKFLANTGICSRREADEYIKAGVISVNGEVVNVLGTKIMPSDSVKFHNQPVQSERKVYILLNKPKNCVTTTEDPNAKKNVMDFVRNACSERIYPVGRLDRNTTGVLLLTNDGDLASKLAHPKFEKKKIYQVTLDKPLSAADFRTVMLGVELEDGKIAADALEYVNIEKKTILGIEIHSGKNRIVRRIFEQLGYKVKSLDRVMFAGLTKKNLPRGKYRFLAEKEIAFLKMGNF
ncbi:MAG: rRNA pseudouridine synthase [Prevotellaceae bacterium]|jgi:23S rRNA pseudouridine2605 synthase|nr:rRNA pseudouridine synthase [Prevotellaceae bacterium]